ncbi:family 43 glycosylhydrolase [Echinicola jeungdonensis]|uniref:Family 43 glycosylhydrolase n=1 Tax=Echinicola jeungdonensis TaxID=709343 RepID=A0ABV5J538_9BACT|nr:family 43 glycosylhydrolase [Echinicola jeungdonensis]MDN3668208.1 family 43 glycosylhydrolase [Echinicola jeungdonensis]
MTRLNIVYPPTFSFILLISFLMGCTSEEGEKSEKMVEEVKQEQTFQNPILGGDYPDPTIIRDGKDYYMTHSSFEYYPGLLIWHSTDLIHWERVAFALKENIGSVWAPDLIKHKGIYYIYFPAGGTNWVVTSKSPEGPWSAPVDLKLEGYIDPGHVVDEEGNRYLYLSKGYVVALADDGLSNVGKPEPGYQGWEFPKSWSTECFCLESPKSTVKNGYYYQTVAEGGTAGPATSHMVVSGRAKSPLGPWENSPYNPIVHTDSREERWWSQGHGSLVDDVEGNWWILYHGYEKDFHTLGRQTLMLPIEWTEDDWFRVPAGVSAGDPIRKPAGSNEIAEDVLSDDFSGKELGLQWQFFNLYSPERVEMENGQLELMADGNSFENSSPLLVNAKDRNYEIQVEYTLEEGATAGLTLFYDEQANMRISVDTKQFTVYNQEHRKISESNQLGKHGFIRILNDAHEVILYFSADGKDWQRVERTIYAQGFNHNIFGRFLSLRAGLFAFGEGKVKFDNFIYREL